MSTFILWWFSTHKIFVGNSDLGTATSISCCPRKYAGNFHSYYFNVYLQSHEIQYISGHYIRHKKYALKDDMPWSPWVSKWYKKLAILIKAHKMTFFSSKIIFYIYINMFAFWAFSGAFAAHIILIDEIKLKTQKNLSSRNMQYLKAFFFMECSLVEKFHFGFVFRNHRNIQHKNYIHLKMCLLTPFYVYNCLWY